MERRNIAKKKKRARESGDHDRCHGHIHVHGHTEKRTEMMTNSNKKLEYPHDQFGCVESSDRNCRSLYEICDHHDEEEEEEEVGVFDFPWLKEEGEGLIFEGDHHEYLCLQGMGIVMGMGLALDHLEEDQFVLYSSCLSADDTDTNTIPSTKPLPALHQDHTHDLTSFSAQKIPSIFHDNDDNHHPKLEDNHLRLGTDEHAIEYCIWSSVLDQPLDISLNI